MDQTGMYDAKSQEHFSLQASGLAYGNRTSLLLLLVWFIMVGQYVNCIYISNFLSLGLAGADNNHIAHLTSQHA